MQRRRKHQERNGKLGQNSKNSVDSFSSQLAKIGLIQAKEISDETTEFFSGVLDTDLEVVEEELYEEECEQQLEDEQHQSPTSWLI